MRGMGMLYNGSVFPHTAARGQGKVVQSKQITYTVSEY